MAKYTFNQKDAKRIGNAVRKSERVQSFGGGGGFPLPVGAPISFLVMSIVSSSEISGGTARYRYSLAEMEPGGSGGWGLVDGGFTTGHGYNFSESPGINVFYSSQTYYLPIEAGRIVQVFQIGEEFWFTAVNDIQTFCS